MAALILIALLAAPDPRIEAWDAFRAGEEGTTAAIPALRAGLRARVDQEDAPSVRARGAILDALIRLQAPVPWEELKPLWKRHRTEVFLLAAIARDETALVECLDDLGNLPWQAACNLLAARRNEDLARHLLKTLELKVHLQVVTPGSNVMHGLGGRCGGGRGCGRLTVWEGWPPLARYKLTTEKARGAIAFAPGKCGTVFYRRRTYDVGTHGVGSSSSWTDRNPMRIVYLNEVLGRDSQLVYEVTAHIEWTGADAYVRDAMKARDEVRGKFAAVAKALLKPDERVEPKITLEVHDVRDVKKPALPKLPG